MKSFSIKSLALACLVTLGASSASFAEMDGLAVSGSYLGGANLLRQSNRISNRFGFDYSANIDFAYQIGEKFHGILQLQAAPGNGNLGHNGPSAALTDIALTYQRNDYHTATFGSFDTPFGQKTFYLTNNADTFGNFLIINDLMYSALGGTVGTLNTIGFKTTIDKGPDTLILSVTNGTDESASNPDGRFEVLAHASTRRLNENLSLGASVMKSNDLAKNNSGANGFQANFFGAIVDGLWTVSEKLSVNAYGALLDFGDDNSTTKDKVTTWMLEGKYTLKQNFFSARVSGWMPEDNDGNGSGMSPWIPNPGLAITQGAVSPLTDQNVTRFEVGVGHELEDNVVLKTEVFYDKYAKETSGQKTNVPGVLAYVNVSL